MGVGIQCEPCTVVPKHPRDCFDVHAILQGQCGECMSEVVEPDAGEPARFNRTFNCLYAAPGLVGCYGFSGLGNIHSVSADAFPLLSRAAVLEDSTIFRVPALVLVSPAVSPPPSSR